MVVGKEKCCRDFKNISNTGKCIEIRLMVAFFIPVDASAGNKFI